MDNIQEILIALINSLRARTDLEETQIHSVCLDLMFDVYSHKDEDYRDCLINAAFDNATTRNT